ncbi:MAG: ribosome maturation factor RimP [Nitrospirota bacterium]|nr:MAG: ribosome maturation factor RimP [Nitrospirota bacterium]
MPKKEVIDKVSKLAEEVADDYGVELVDVELLGSGRKMTLRVTIDAEGGVGLDSCQKVSRELEALLDVEDPISGSYTLEVGSPGLDRPLKKIDDFRRFVGKLAKVVTLDQVDGQNYFVGRIVDISGDDIKLELEKGEMIINFDNIKKANLEVEF